MCLLCLCAKWHGDCTSALLPFSQLLLHNQHDISRIWCGILPLLCPLGPHDLCFTARDILSCGRWLLYHINMVFPHLSCDFFLCIRHGYSIWCLTLFCAWTMIQPLCETEDWYLVNLRETCWINNERTRPDRRREDPGRTRNKDRSPVTDRPKWVSDRPYFIMGGHFDRPLFSDHFE